MNQPRRFVKILKRRLPLAMSALLPGLFIVHLAVYGQDKSDFPDGFDAVQAAPKSHKVIFENAFVRVLEVTISPGTTVPRHHTVGRVSRQDTTRPLPSCRRECSGHSEHERGDSSRHMECGMDET